MLVLRAGGRKGEYNFQKQLKVGVHFAVMAKRGWGRTKCCLLCFYFKSDLYLNQELLC